MIDPLRPVLDQLEKIWARLDRVPVISWATVTQTDPLRIRLDGDDDPLPFTPSSPIAGLSVGSRVVCVEQHRRVIILA